MSTSTRSNCFTKQKQEATGDKSSKNPLNLLLWHFSFSCWRGLSPIPYRPYNAVLNFPFTLPLIIIFNLQFERGKSLIKARLPSYLEINTHHKDISPAMCHFLPNCFVGFCITPPWEWWIITVFSSSYSLTCRIFESKVWNYTIKLVY